MAAGVVQCTCTPEPLALRRLNKELLLTPLVVARNQDQRVLMESSVNSVRVSLKIRQLDSMDKLLAGWFCRFLMQRAEQFLVLRRRPVKGYDLSFLITNRHLDSMWKHKLIDFIITFMEEVDKEISSLKISLNARAGAVARTFLSAAERV